MAQPKVYEGTWDELAQRADELRSYPRLTLIIAAPGDGAGGHFRADLSPEERIRMLDAIAERNKCIPALPPEAFERESLYADDGEHGLWSAVQQYLRQRGDGVLPLHVSG